MRARAARPEEPPSELEALKRRCEELENAVLAGHDRHAEKAPAQTVQSLFVRII